MKILVPESKTRMKMPDGNSSIEMQDEGSHLTNNVLSRKSSHVMTTNGNSHVMSHDYTQEFLKIMLNISFAYAYAYVWPI